MKKILLTAFIVTFAVAMPAEPADNAKRNKSLNDEQEKAPEARIPTDEDDFEWTKERAMRGDALAQGRLGDMYSEGKGVRQDKVEAVKWYRKAAEQGNARMQDRLGDIYAKGEGVRQDKIAAAKWYRKAAEQVDDVFFSKHRQNSLGYKFDHGEGVNEDKVEAMKWYRKAAERGLDIAQSNLAEMYYHGKGVQQDKVEAAKWYRKAANQGHAHAQLRLGGMYFVGDGMRQDKAEAAKWFRKAADNGNALAQGNLGVMYYTGDGVSQDEAEAVKWFRKAAEQGDAQAQYRLGYMYQNGKGVREDDNEAAKWYGKAAELGHAWAQFKLGDMYSDGQGVSLDLAEAAKWFRKAQTNPDADAEVIELVNFMLARLDPQNLTATTTATQVERDAPAIAIHGGLQQRQSQGEFKLSGTAKDASGLAELRIDGQAVAFGAGGQFTLPRYLALGETRFQIEAIDIHGNRASQMVTVVREAEAPAVASEPDLIPPAARIRSNPQALALIVGVQDYRNAPQARHAAQDAARFYDYAQRTLGIPAGNIKLLTGDAANRTGLLSALKTWLAPMVTPGKSQVYVYFAGHGLAASDGDRSYLIPQDGDPALLEDTALDRQRLLDEIAKARPLSATLFLDTCYSGGARGGEGTLVANARPIMIKSKAATLPPSFMQFSAASNDQLAHSHPSQPHGLFSYYLMRGLAGEADANKDNKLTAGELQDYVQEKVKRMALTQGRPQEPELIGDRDKVLAIW